MATVAVGWRRPGIPLVYQLGVNTDGEPPPPPPPVPQIRLGLAAPESPRTPPVLPLFAEALTIVNRPIHARRVYGTEGVTPWISATRLDNLAAQARTYNALPVISLRPPGADMAGLAAGTYNADLDILTTWAAAQTDPVVIIFWHEPDGSPFTLAEWAAGQAHVADYLSGWRTGTYNAGTDYRDKARLGVVPNGNWWGPVQTTKIAQALPDSLLAKIERAGGILMPDIYDRPPGYSTAARMTAFRIWAQGKGLSVGGLGEFGCLNEASLSAAWAELKSNSNFWDVCIYYDALGAFDGDPRLIPFGYPRTDQGGGSYHPFDFGGTPTTAAMLALFQQMLDQVDTAGIPAAPKWLAYENENQTGWPYPPATLVGARFFDQINVQPWRFTAPEIATIRGGTPRTNVAVYANVTMAQANEGPGMPGGFPLSWYVKDPAGNPVSNNWDLWLMDPTNAGWIANRTALVQARVLEDGGYDAWFGDMTGYGTLYLPTLSGIPINPATGVIYTRAEWFAAVTTIVTAIRASVTNAAGQPVPCVLNGLVSGLEYFDLSPSSGNLFSIADVMLTENHTRTSFQGPTTYKSTANWLKDVEMLEAIGVAGKKAWAITKCWVTNPRAMTAAEVRNWHEYSLASFLLASNGQHCYAFESSRTHNAMLPESWWATVETAFILATGAKSLVGSVYARTFIGGHVAVVNPTTSTQTYALPAGSWLSLQGVPYSGVVSMAPNSGLVLIKS